MNLVCVCGCAEQHGRWACTVRPAHSVVQFGGYALPQSHVFGVPRVHLPQVVVKAPVLVVFEEVRLVVVEPHEGSIHALHGQAEVADWPGVALFCMVVFENPVLDSCRKKISEQT